MSSAFLLSLIRGIGRAFCLLATVCLLVCAFFLTFLPETKGKSLEDMSMYFAEVTGDHILINVNWELEKLRRDSILYTDESSEYENEKA
eukprot:scaffold6438_cov181-Amphora_coffeaeformis.AAC.8